MLCLLILIGVWAYAGSPFPQTQGANDSEEAELWIEWSIIVAVPTITALLWLLRLRTSDRE
jgi:hypothetical protein